MKKFSVCLAVLAVAAALLIPCHNSVFDGNLAVAAEPAIKANESSVKDVAVFDENGTKVPAITADYAIVIEANTGRVIYEKNADERAYPASTTKMLTCIMALEKNKLDDVLVVSQNAAWTEDAYLGLQQGDQLTQRDLIKALMMVSDNSAAVVLAEDMGGSVAAFSDMMNKKAKEIGLTNSHFITPNGLPDPDHYSTARDMAMIAAYAWHNDKFRSFAGTKEDAVEWKHPANKKIFVDNSNKLLGVMPGVNGIKTGWTSAAGGCLAASAKRDGVQLIAVVLHSADTNTRFVEAGELLEYGFGKVEKMKSVDKARTERTVFVSNGAAYKVTAHPQDDVSFPLMKGENEKDYTVKITGASVVNAPVEKGQQVGQATVYYKGKKLNTIPMVADNTVDSGNNILSMGVGILHRFGFLK